MIIRDNFCEFCIKTYVVTPHQNRLIEPVQMRGHNIWFRLEIIKVIIKYSLLSHGDEPYQILVVQNRILFVISGLYLCKRVFVGRGKYPENHM